MTRRQEQLASVVHRAVQSIITEGLADPRIEGVITITKVKVTEDFREAIISVSVLPEKHESKVIHGLADAANYIKRTAGERIALHRMPKIIFKLDRDMKRQAAVLGALAEVRRETESTAHDAGEAATHSLQNPHPHPTSPPPEQSS